MLCKIQSSSVNCSLIVDVPHTYACWNEAPLIKYGFSASTALLLPSPDKPAEIVFFCREACTKRCMHIKINVYGTNPYFSVKSIF